MAIDIKFDLVGNPEPPTIILANRNGNKLGQLQVDEKSINLVDRFNDASEFSFTLNKFVDGELTNLWNSVVDFKLVYCKEWDMWFEIKVELDESTSTIKTVFCKQLGQAELSQIMLYNIEINNEDDQNWDKTKATDKNYSYKKTILYDDKDNSSSLLHRLLDKAPHYSVVHVDDTIKDIQRTFSFDNISIYDAFMEIAEEIGCLFVFHSNSDENGKVQRTISVYDLQQNCNVCKHRGEFTDKCPNVVDGVECGSTNIRYGYGEDTTIFVTSDELASSGIQLTTDTDSVKNCFKLEAGDDLMTATVRNCNPNGSDYIWYFSDAVKEDMSDELVEKIESYDELYNQYYNNHISNLDAVLVNKYNSYVDKYSSYKEDLQKIITPINGYSSLMQAYYNVVDLAMYLKSGLMPTVKISGTSAEEQKNLLTSYFTSSPSVAVTNAKIASPATANSAVLSMAKIIVKATYKVEIQDADKIVLIDNGDTKTWHGKFIITNYSDEDDKSITDEIYIEVNDDLETFINQKIDKALDKENTDDLSITGLFKKEYSEFCEELKKYALNPLKGFRESCEICLSILQEQGVANSNGDDSWSDTNNGSEANLYEKIYIPYFNKSEALENEIAVRQKEVNDLVGIYDENNKLVIEGLQTNIEKFKNEIQITLNFEKYLGSNLWTEFCSYRREDKYSNDNYISDGSDNAKLFKDALEFIEAAKNEIYKSAELQNSISTSLKNLLAIEKFKSLVNSFKVGNWIRVQVDNKLYKLRLLEYEIDYGSFNDISVEFSDVIKIKNGITDVSDVLSQASSMATSYDYVQKQASQGEESNSVLNNWFDNGLNITNTKIVGADNQSQIWGKYGILCRQYDPITGTYSNEQLKIINSTIAITNDNWKTTKTAIGKHYYTDPSDNQLKCGYGINAEVLVGKLILGEQLGIYNKSGSLTFNEDGFKITNGVNSFRVNPNSDVLLSISNKDNDVFYIDRNGKLHISGDGSALDISANADITGLSSKITQTVESITLDVNNKVDGLNSKITQNANSITAEVTNRQNADNNLSSRITQNADSITSEVTRATKAEGELNSKITQNANSITAEVTNRQNADNNLSSRITQNADSITSEVTRATKAEGELNSKITQNANSITAKVSKTGGNDSSFGWTLTDSSWTINANGNTVLKATKDGLDITGVINAKEGGTVGGWNIGEYKIYGGNSSTGVTAMLIPTSSSPYVFASGGTTHSSYDDCPFRVTKDGKVYASNIDMSGVFESLDAGLSKFRKNYIEINADGKGYIRIGEPGYTGFEDITMRPSEDMIGNIGTPDYRWDTLWVRVNASSSKREIKEHIQNYNVEQAYEELKTLPLYTYFYKGGSSATKAMSIGTMIDYIPTEAMITTQKDNDAYNASSMIFWNIAASQVMQKKLEDLILEVDEIKSKLEHKEE